MPSNEATLGNYLRSMGYTPCPPQHAPESYLDADRLIARIERLGEVSAALLRGDEWQRLWEDYERTYVTSIQIGKTYWMSPPPPPPRPAPPRGSGIRIVDNPTGSLVYCSVTDLERR